MTEALSAEIERACARIIYAYANCASGTCYLTLYRGIRHENGPLPLESPFLVGHYEDRFVRTPDGWKFALRKLKTTFRSGAAS